MHKRTDLSAGALNGSDRLTVQLIERAGKPPFVAINWPARPSVCTPTAYDQIAATCMRLLANASVRLAQLKARGEL
jgi:hypothetical protein